MVALAITKKAIDNFDSVLLAIAAFGVFVGATLSGYGRLVSIATQFQSVFVRDSTVFIRQVRSRDAISLWRFVNERCNIR